MIDERATHQRRAGRTLRSLKPVGVIQELYGLLLAHYAVRAVMHEAALEADIDPDRLSFVHALHVLQDAIAEFQMTVPEQLGALYGRLLRDIASVRLPERAVRANPRVVKRKMSSFGLKRPGSARAPRPRGSWRDAVALLPPSAPSGEAATPLDPPRSPLQEPQACLRVWNEIS